MNQAESLCHSSGPWKKHKYISKVGEGAKAVYKYAKKAAGYAYGSEYRKDMDKYHDAEDRAQANMWKANEDNWKLKNKIEDNAKNGGPDAVIKGKALRKEKERNQEYFDKQYAKAQNANDKYGRAGTKYYNSLAYKVEKATGSYDKSRAERARKKGYDGLAERHEAAYEKSAGAKAKKSAAKVKSLAADSIQRGQEKIDKLFGKSTTKRTVTDTKTGKTRTPKSNASDAINIKELSKKNKKQVDNSNVFTLGPDGTTQAPTNKKWRKVK